MLCRNSPYGVVSNTHTCVVKTSEHRVRQGLTPLISAGPMCWNLAQLLFGTKFLSSGEVLPQCSLRRLLLSILDICVGLPLEVRVTLLVGVHTIPLQRTAFHVSLVNKPPTSRLVVDGWGTPDNLRC